MPSFQLTKLAKFDLKTIAITTEKKWGRNQRRIYLKQFDDTFHLLAETPDIGIGCDYIKEGYRKFPVTSHVVFYRALSSSHIEIVRILHKRMDAKKNFAQS